MARPEMHYYYDFEGGLGDVFIRMFTYGEYQKLERIEIDTATVIVRSCNPFTVELFQNFPKQSQLDVRNLGFWTPYDKERMRRLHQLPRSSELTSLPHDPSKPILFYPFPGEQAKTEPFKPLRFVVLAASAGELERIIPESNLERIFAAARRHKTICVVVGRKFERRGRFEPEIRESDLIHNLVNKLSVPAVGQIVRECVGVICSHSAVCMLGWLLKKPTLLLYPEVVYNLQILGGNRQYMFGLDYENSLHAQFSELTDDLLDKFFEKVLGHPKWLKL